MTAKLLFRDERAGRDIIIDLTLSGVVIGRGQDCAVRTDDPLVSRRNTKISFNGARWSAEDLGSSNGTFVNEQRIKSQLLMPQDVVRCGSLQVRFVEIVEELEQVATQLIAPAATGMQASVPQPMPVASIGPSLSMTRVPAPEPQAALPPVPPELIAINAELVEENARLKKRLDELVRAQASHHDEVQALTDIGKELGIEVRTLRSDGAEMAQRLSLDEEELQARDRQLERAHEDVERHKQAADEMAAQLAEAKKTADDGWRQLKASQGELEKLRRVMGQQERLLDERRMGLTALETAIQTLRAERDKLVLSQISLVNERDELRRAAGMGHSPTLEMVRNSG